jgi:hypothetical protein
VKLGYVIRYNCEPPVREGVALKNTDTFFSSGITFSYCPSWPADRGKGEKWRKGGTDIGRKGGGEKRRLTRSKNE